MAPSAPEPVPPAWAAELFTAPLTPAVFGPDGDVAVWSVEDAASSAQISEQFKANAGDYHARYGAAVHFEGLFRQAIAATGIEPPAEPLVLDLGSGSGVNSIVPCLRIFPAARFVATDLSAELLSILADYVRREGFADRVICVVMDAMGDHMARRRFDLVTGAAILHHLDKPHRALISAARALKPDARAIFMEPFDGYGVLRLALERILCEADLRHEPLTPEVAAAMGAVIGDIAGRTNPDPNSPAFEALDDKWLFSRPLMEVMARDANFSDVQCVPHNDHPSLYRDAADTQLRLILGHAPEWPAWAADILDGFDRALTMFAKRELMLEASVVLTKGPTQAPGAPNAPETMPRKAGLLSKWLGAS